MLLRRSGSSTWAIFKVCECPPGFVRQEIQVETGRVRWVEGMKSESFPPRACLLMDRHRDDRLASSFRIDLERSGEHVSDEGRANPESGMAIVDREATEQERGDRLRRLFRH